ncbi:MAG: LPS assembly protein LptD [Gammaproteobacteria bacterium]|nr:LPS assembly protein LptD [Gammaproteobacteria bacterium]MBI5615397.1 LPS assembly protein LptD [Gammaproteobacteria bacterium]
MDRRTTLFVGNVEFVHGDQSAVADEVLYDQDASTANLEGRTSLWGPGLIWQGEKAFFNLDTKYGKLESGQYWLVDSPARGFAEEIRESQREKVSRLFRVDYTTCPEGAERWKFSASKIKLDRNNDRGYATNALLKVLDVPVFYFPYMSFPLSDKRKSGFLTPTFGSSTRAGTDVRIPYYVNLAPNYDLIVEPRIVSEHGMMLGGEARYLTEHARGNLNAEFLPSDNLNNGANRYVIRFQHQQSFDSGHGGMYALYETASDKRYFEDFGNSLAVSSQVFLDRRIQTSYVNNYVYLTGLLQDYQSIDTAIPGWANPYSRLPQVYAQTMMPMVSMRPYFFASSEVTYFDRPDSVTGARVEVLPSISLPWIKPYALIKPTLTLRQANYMLTNTGNFPGEISRTIPYFSVDSQFFLERRLDLFGLKMLQTFEPRAYYLIVPKVHQHDIPIFDTAMYDFSFLTLFLDNRFAGRDRVGDTNQLAMGLTSRFVGLDSGRELVRASLGQIYYFKEPSVALPNTVAPSHSTSDLIGELSSNLTEDLSARVTALWDPNSSDINKAALTLRYRPTARAVVNASYRLNRAVTDVDQTDFSFRMPLTDTLAAVGRWNYSLKTAQTLEYVGGLELESCCWGLRLVTRRYIFNAQGQFDTAVFVQAELKGLSGYGRGAVSFLRKSVPGYESYF